MKVTIFKYLKHPTIDYNYFSGALGLWDKIVLERQLINGFPIFQEEWSLEDDVNILKTGYFDMTLSLIMSERSSGGKNILEFFESMTSTIDKYKYVIVCQTDNAERSYSGIIDNTSLKADLTINDNRYHISLAVYGIEKEAVDWIQKRILFPISHDMDFESEYLPWHFKDLIGNPLIGELLSVQSNLNINEKIFDTLIVTKTVQNDFIDRSLNFNCWEGLKSFLIGFAVRFKVLFSHIGSNYPRFILKLFFRSDGLNDYIEVIKPVTHESTFNKAGSKWIFISYTERSVQFAGRDATQHTGFLMSKENIYYATGGLTSPVYIHHVSEYDVYYYGNAIIFGKDVQKINLPLFDIQYAAGKFAYCRIADNKIFKVWQLIANVELGYLLEAFKVKKNLKVKVNDDSNLILGSKADIDGNNFVLERINSYDNYNKTMETEWVEV